MAIDIEKTLALLVEFRAQEKLAFQPSGVPAQGAPPPGMGGGAPMPPGGAPPMDPAAMGGAAPAPAPLPPGQPPVTGLDPNLLPQLVTGFEQVVQELGSMRESQDTLMQELATTKEELMQSKLRLDQLDQAMKAPSGFEGPGAMPPGGPMDPAAMGAQPAMPAAPAV